MTHSHHPRAAFSLIELSIVIVIIGLLVGGILMGQSLIRSAEIKSVISDLQKYQSAVKQFRDQYTAMPGDMANATNYWGSAGGTGSDNTCYGTASTTVTCNGDGDGYVENVGPYGAAEPHRAWQHLANAGLIAGQYSGEDVCSSLGTTSPRSRVSNAGFDIVYGVYAGSWGDLFSNSIDGNMISFGTVSCGVTRGAALTPEEAWSMDGKMDDSKPDTGKLQVGTTYGGASCATGAYPNAAYALSTKTIQCSLRYSLR